MNGFLVKAFPPINASSIKKKILVLCHDNLVLDNGDLD